MSVQQEVSRELNAARVGQEIDVIVDDVDEEGAIARSKWDAPEIDGSVFLNSAKDLAQGDIVRARIVASDAYDVWAEGGA
jgi:ribosomal protein S12 methylthiotransferase